MRKGKTHRRRKSISQSNKNNSYIDENLEVINLKKWIKRTGYTMQKKMRLAEFPETGRGVMAYENVDVNDILMKVPFRSIINMITLENDSSFKAMVFTVAVENKVKCSCQELLAFYLVYIKLNMENYQFWSAYIDSLPENLNIPYFFKIPLDNILDDSIYNIINIQKEKVLASYLYFKNIVVEVSKANKTYSEFLEKFSLDIFEWSYFIVNTRCVYLDSMVVSKICKSSSILPMKSKFVDMISDRPSLGLIPYLDMINHSSGVKTSTNLRLINVNSKCTADDYVNSYEDNLYFELITLTKFKKYEEIFISYGDHCNLKLLTEYGFTIPCNPFTTVAINVEDLYRLIKKNVIILPSQIKYKFIKKHNLYQNLNVTIDGFNYNFLRLLFVLTNDNMSIWESKIFSSNFEITEYEEMHKLGLTILHEKKSSLEHKLATFYEMNLNDSQYCSSLSLMKEYIFLINNIEKFVN